MNELMIHVERAVRPVHAGAARKRRMRQELLAHLTAVYEEERARLGDERPALDQALARFGNPADLTRDLQASVPRLEQWESRLVGWFLRRSGEPVPRHAVRLAAVFAAFAFCMLFFLPLLLVLAGQDWSNVRIGLVHQGVVTGYMFFAALVGYALYSALTVRVRTAALLRGGACAVAAVLVGLAMVVGGYVTQPENPLWEFLLRSPGDSRSLPVLAFFAGWPLPLGLGARLATAWERRDDDFARLEVGA